MDSIQLARAVYRATHVSDYAPNQVAPDIQEALLSLPATKGKPEIHEKRMRPTASMLLWEDQRGAWRQISDEVGCQIDALAESADRF